MPGLDPGIYDLVRRKRSYVRLPTTRLFMDCRVKPGNDNGKRVPRSGG
jgi:hypothetical protein